MAKNRRGRTSQTGAVIQTARVPTPRDSLIWDAAPAEITSHVVEFPWEFSDPTTEQYRSFVAPYSRERSGHGDRVLSWRPSDRSRRVSRAFPSGTPRGVTASRFRPLLVNPWGLLVRLPQRVAFCVRRKIRRQVLFSRKVAGFNRRRSPGRGGGYRRSQSSSWSC